MSRDEADPRRRSDREPGAVPPGRWTAPLAAALALALVGCGLSGPEDSSSEIPLSISATASQRLVRASSGPAARTDLAAGPSAGPSRSITIAGSDGNTLVIDFVAFLVTNARLKPGGAEQCDGDSGCVVLRSSPRLLTVPLDGSTRSQIVKRVGRGLFDEISFRLVTAADSNDALLDSLPEFEGGSLMVRGCYNGEPFSVTRSPSGPVRIPISPGLVIDESTNATNLTLSTAVPSWFELPDGGVLDPREESGRLSTGLIEASTSAFPDRDGDGEPDRTGPGAR